MMCSVNLTHPYPTPSWSSFVISLKVVRQVSFCFLFALPDCLLSNMGFPFLCFLRRCLGVGGMVSAS